ncbi:MAG: acyl--CoA ligase [Rhodobacteraceae bacterium]|nr:acyl--CoA ligase [Paracoccaceae bacterium]
MNTQRSSDAPAGAEARTLPDLLLRNCRDFADSVCLVDPPNRARVAQGDAQRLTWAQLGQRVDRMALVLVDQGIKKGEIVLLAAPTLHETLVVQLACLRLGIIVASFPVQYREAEVGGYVRRLSPRAMIGHARLGKHANAAMLLDIARGHDAPLPVLSFGISDLPQGVIALEPDAARALDAHEARRLRDAYARADIQPDDVAFIVFTSGTSAAPKAVPRTQAVLFHMRRFLHDTADFPQGGCFLSPRMLNTIGALANGISSWLFSAARMVLHHPFDIEVFLEQIATERPEVTSCPPAILTLMLERIDQGGGGVDLSSLHHITTGSAQLNPRLITEFRDRFGIDLINVYGSSEGAMLVASVADVPDAADRAHYFPRLNDGPRPSKLPILAQYTTRLVDPATDQPITEPGMIGELRLKGGPILERYWDDPEGTAAAFDAEGWFRTGDLFSLAGEASEYLQFTGRLKHIIVRGGLNISAEEIQVLAQTHPAVADAVAVAVPDATMGEKVGLAVTLRGGASLTLPELCAHLTDTARIAVFKLPEYFCVLDELPVLPSGKTDQNAVRALFRAPPKH